MSPCSRCGMIGGRQIAVSLTSEAPAGRVSWTLCSDCQLGLLTWYGIRQAETPTKNPALDRRAAELLHACRMALDACGKYPQISDTLRTAIKRALE